MWAKKCDWYIDIKIYINSEINGMQSQHSISPGSRLIQWLHELNDWM